MIVSNGISERMKSYMKSSGKKKAEVSREIGISIPSVSSALGSKPMRDETIEAIRTFLDKVEEKPKPIPKRRFKTFRRFGEGFVFVYPSDLGRLSEEERGIAKSAKLERGRQYYCKGRSFVAIKETHIFEED